MKCILALSKLEALFFSDPTHHHTWRKRKILDPSSKSLAQRQEVVHVVSSLIFVTLSMFPHSLQVLRLFCSCSISWHKSLQDSVSCVFSFLFPLSGIFFCRICEMHRAVQDAYEMPMDVWLDFSPPRLTQSSLSGTWINTNVPNIPLSRLLCDFSRNPLCIYAICRGSSLSRCKELLYSEMYWDLKIPVYCAWKHPQRRALDLNYVHLFPLMTSLMLPLNAC